MKLGFICQPDTANAYYRVVYPMEEMERRGHRVIWPGNHDYDAILAGRPDWDLMHVHQCFGAEDVELVTRFREAGMAIVWDSDDDVLSVPKGTESYRKYGRRRGLRRMFEQTLEMARACHLMTTTNEHLAQIYRDNGVEHVAVIGNYLSRAVMRPKRRVHQGVVVGMMAANEHGTDIDRLGIARALRRVQQTHQDVSVVALGVDLGLRERYVHRPRVPFQQINSYLSAFDIALAPLLDSPFNRSRSNVKLKEYANAGAVWLASPVGPYADMGAEHGGLLVGDDEWFDAIDGLVSDARRRSELAACGRRWASTQSIRAAGPTWEAAFRDAVIRAKREAGRLDRAVASRR